MRHDDDTNKLLREKICLLKNNQHSPDRYFSPSS